ncbi:MAG: hypothetical protein ACLFVW_04510 [Phycisphaerae bacterium]
MSNHRLFICVAVLAGVFSSAGVVTAQPRLDFSCDQLPPGRLPEEIRQQVRQFVSHWTNAMLQTETDSEVAEARSRIIEGYSKCPDSVQYQTDYARAVVDKIGPVLASDDPLKQVNGALLVANTPNMRVRPVLDEMVSHSNPAVRYLGWRGYQRARTLVLAQGRDYSQPLFGSLAERLQAETVPFVVRRLLETLYLPPSRPQVVSQGDYDWARRQAMEAFLSGWSEQCRRLLLVEPELPEAMVPGLWAISGFRRVIGDSQAEKSKLAQPMVDVMYCASRAYDEADPGSDDDRVRRANATLLTEAEESLNELTELRRNYLSQALTAENVPDRGAEVRRAVLDWVDDLSQAGFDIQRPGFEPPQQPDDGTD